MGGALIRHVRRSEERLAMAAVSACIVVAVFVPLAVLTAQSLLGSASEIFRHTLAEPRTWVLFGKSVGLALAITFVSLLLGVLMGGLLGKTDLAGSRVALLVHLFPVFLPPFVGALGWFHVFGRQGVAGSEWTSTVLFGPLGVVLTLSSIFAPIVSALTVLGLQGIDPSVEEAARTVSRPARVVSRILLPLAWPSIALGAIAVFALSLSEVGVPMLLRVPTYSAAVFARLGGVHPAPGEAIALVVPLVLLALLLVFVDRRLLGRRSWAALGLRRGANAPLPLGRARPWVTAAVWAASLTSLVPVAALATRAGALGFEGALHWVGESLWTSLASAGITALLIVFVGLIVGHALARDSRTARVIDALALLGLIVPSSVLGVGLIATWNRPGARVVYATLGILVLGLFARYAVLGVRTMAAIFHRTSPHFEQAAAAYGAGFSRRLGAILIPMHWRGLLAAWLIAFVFCLRDLDTVITFYPPGLEPLPVRIFTLEANGPEAIVAALSIYHALLTAAVLIAGITVLGITRRRA